MGKLVTVMKLGNINIRIALKTLCANFYKLLEMFSKLNITEVENNLNQFQTFLKFVTKFVMILIDFLNSEETLR